MTEKNIYALASTLQQTDSLQQEMRQMLSSLQNAVETEYLQKIRNAARSEKIHAAEHPPREVTLLRALSAFTDDHGKEQIDRMTHGLLFLHTMQQIRQCVSAVSCGNLLETRSAEGQLVETPLSARSAEMAGLFLTLAMMEQL